MIEKKELNEKEINSLIIKTIYRYFPNGKATTKKGILEFDDLFQEGRIAYLESLQRYDSTKMNFKSYFILLLRSTFSTIYSISITSQRNTSTKLRNVSCISMEENEVDLPTYHTRRCLKSMIQQDLVEFVLEGYFRDKKVSSFYAKIIFTLKAKSYSVKEIAEMLNLSYQQIQSIWDTVVGVLRKNRKKFVNLEYII